MDWVCACVCVEGGEGGCVAVTPPCGADGECLRVCVCVCGVCVCVCVCGLLPCSPQSFGREAVEVGGTTVYVNLARPFVRFASDEALAALVRCWG